jgi:tRNA(fMet)-specific endonuclease VapC
MTLKILDTVTLSLLERKDLAVLRRFLVVPPSEVAITVINVEEQMTGWQIYLRRAKTDKELAAAYERLANSVRVLSGMRILGFSEFAIARYKMLSAMKLNVGKMDLRIAAIALDAGATVITRNLGDFQRVPGLICENWAD